MSAAIEELLRLALIDVAEMRAREQVAADAFHAMERKLAVAESLFQEQRRVFVYYVQWHGPCIDGHKDDADPVADAEGIELEKRVNSVLDLTPEEMTSELARLREEVKGYRVRPTAGDLRARIATLETDNETEREVFRSDLAKLEAHRDALISAGNAMRLRLDSDLLARSKGLIVAWEASIKGDIGIPISETADEKLSRRLREVRCEFGSLSAFFDAARKAAE